MVKHVNAAPRYYFPEFPTFFQQFLLAFQIINSRKPTSTKLTAVINYLKDNALEIDGDLTSQVYTALKQAIQKGIIIENCDNYSLTGPLANVISTCPESHERKQEYDRTRGIFTYRDRHARTLPSKQQRGVTKRIEKSRKKSKHRKHGCSLNKMVHSAKSFFTSKSTPSKGSLRKVPKKKKSSSMIGSIIATISQTPTILSSRLKSSNSSTINNKSSCSSSKSKRKSTKNIKSCLKKPKSTTHVLKGKASTCSTNSRTIGRDSCSGQFCSLAGKRNKSCKSEKVCYAKQRTLKAKSKGCRPRRVKQMKKALKTSRGRDVCNGQYCSLCKSSSSCKKDHFTQ